MATPAQRHAMRVSAIRASQRDNAPLRHASPYEQMLVKLAADRRTLSAIRSKERKADKKRELLPLYLPWVAGVLESGTGAQDDILMTVMLWMRGISPALSRLRAMRCVSVCLCRKTIPAPHLTCWPKRSRSRQPAPELPGSRSTLRNSFASSG